MRSSTSIVVIAATAVVSAFCIVVTAQPSLQDIVRIDDDDMGGVVRGSSGPEAGVWVIAETRDLPTGFRKIVVTDDRGRYVMPDLPRATYRVWVRGYGLIDSPPVQASPGRQVDLRTVPAPDARGAAEYYPALYWYSLLKIPAKSEFSGTGRDGSGIASTISSQAHWIEQIKTDSCYTCHQLGNKATRQTPPSLGLFASSVDAWSRRIQSGHDGGAMASRMAFLGRRALVEFADWTDRISAGELPPVPPRPKELERNLVITQWDVAGPTDYFHDVISTDKRHPTLNANGPIYGFHENSTDKMTVLDPVRNSWKQVPIPVRDPNMATPPNSLQPSPYWGDQTIWNSRSSAHSVAMDTKGRLWVAAAFRPPANPAYCREGSNHPSARLFPTQQTLRQIIMYDPKTEKFSPIDTCASSHHVNLGEDADETLWFSGRLAQVVGWLNIKAFDKTGDVAASHGWTPLILDTNGNGRQDAFVEPDTPVDPSKDRRIGAFMYGESPSPVDGAIWGTMVNALPGEVPFQGALIRLDPGRNPPGTALAEIYEPPFGNSRAAVQGFSPRGIDVDRNGVVWTTLASGHFASFDRRRCRGPLNGPAATGQHCPEGWTLFPVPGPHFKDAPEAGSAESNYYNWVDQFDTLGLGKNVPIATGNGSESLLALQGGQWVVMRVPYPMGFFAKGLDGRIDDPLGGWKGRGVWTSYANRTPWHVEGGEGTTSKILRFQMRPDPLAR